MIDTTNITSFVSCVTAEWIAGFFDGEGCISTWKDKTNRYDILVSFTQKDPIVLGLILAKFPSGRLYKHPNRDTYELKYIGRNSKELLELICDKSIVKRSQIIVALEFIKTMSDNNGRGRQPLYEQLTEERQRIHNILKMEKGKSA
jgi:hypothetical protein